MMSIQTLTNNIYDKYDYVLTISNIIYLMLPVKIYNICLLKLVIIICQLIVKEHTGYRQLIIKYPV